MPWLTKEERKESKKKGICNYCGILPAVPGKTKCKYCLLYKAMIERKYKRKTRERQIKYLKERRKRWKEEGRCIRCGRLLGEFEETLTCTNCNEQKNRGRQ